MSALFTSPEIWIGLGLMLGAWLVLSPGGGKQTQARIGRATRKSSAAQVAAAESLRRRDPGMETPFGQMLGGMSSISKLKARFEVAGMDTTPQKFLSIVAAIALGTLFLFTVVLGKSLAVGLLAGVLLGLGLPHFSVGRRIKKRQKAFLKLFPDAIDLMVRGLRAGLPIGESFITVSREIPEPMGDVFGHISQQTGLGVPMEKALSDMAEKLQITEFNFFVTSLILQRETGGNLGEILSNLAEMLRARHMMKLKIGALSSEARASAYIVGSLPLVVMILLQLASPEYLLPLWNDYRGNLSLAAAGGSMAFGALVMRRMTQLEI